MTRAMTKKEIIKALQYDTDAEMCGWIGEFTGSKGFNHNLHPDNYITPKMVMTLENEGVIEFDGYDMWTIPSENEKAYQASIKEA